MFVPPYGLLCRVLGLPEPSLDTNERVTIPQTFLEFLLRGLLAQQPFVEESYLARNPDVAAAIAAGTETSGQAHYLRVGYFEGRSGGPPAVDEAWYLRSNPDVQLAVRRRKLASAAEHYHVAGMQEWRAPNAHALSELQAWQAALQQAEAMIGIHPP